MGGARTIVVLWSIVLILPAASGALASWGSLAGTGSAVDPCDGKVPHPRIRITEDVGPRGFILGRSPGTEDPIYRPGSGVVAGNGTAEEPFVIKGWCVSQISDDTDPLRRPETGIVIEDTTAHVVVRDNWIGDRPFTDADQKLGVWLVGTDNVTVANNRITQNLDHAIQLESTNGTEIRNNTLWANGVHFFDYAIEVEEARGTRITDNVVVDNSAVGIHLDSSDDVTVELNTFKNHSIAVDLTRSHDALISGNRIEGHDGTNVGAVDVDRSNGTTITGNAIQENSGRTTMGVELDHSHGGTISDNTITDNGGEGVRLHESDRNRIARNTFTGNGAGYFGAAVDLDGSMEATIVDNTITENHRQGIWLSWSHGATIARNTITDNGRLGLDLDKADRATILDNTIKRNTAPGTTLDRSQEATMRGNDLGTWGLAVGGFRLADYQHTVDDSNTVDGEPLRYVRGSENVTVSEPAGQVYVINTTDAVIDGVHVSGVWTGIKLVSTTNSTVRDVEVSANGRSGLAVRGATEPTIVHSRIADNGLKFQAPGLLLVDSTGAHIARNTVEASSSGSHKYGILVADSNQSKIANNTLHHNRVGVGLWRSGQITVKNNTIDGLGVTVYESQGSRIEANEFTSGLSIMLGSHAASITANNFPADETAIHVESRSEPVDVKRNWWGAASGPSGGVPDACTDEVANGDGASISLGIANGDAPEVCFDPWLTEPNAEAGVD